MGQTDLVSIGLFGVTGETLMSLGQLALTDHAMYTGKHELLIRGISMLRGTQSQANGCEIMEAGHLGARRVL